MKRLETIFLKVKNFNALVNTLYLMVIVFLLTIMIGVSIFIFNGIAVNFSVFVLILCSIFFAISVFLKIQYDSYLGLLQRAADVHDHIETAHSVYKWYKQGHFKGKVKKYE